MSEQHECEWHFFEESKDGAFCVKGCHGRLSRDEAESRLNEYETLKKATDVFSAEDAKVLLGDYPETYQENMQAVNALRAYTDILEGKDGTE